MSIADTNDPERLFIELRAIEKMLGSFQVMLDESFDGSDEYIEERMHLLNCRYADILIELEGAKELAPNVSHENS